MKKVSPRSQDTPLEENLEQLASSYASSRGEPPECEDLVSSCKGVFLVGPANPTKGTGQRKKSAELGSAALESAVSGAQSHAARDHVARSRDRDLLPIHSADAADAADRESMHGIESMNGTGVEDLSSELEQVHAISYLSR